MVARESIDQFNRRRLMHSLAGADGVTVHGNTQIAKVPIPGDGTLGRFECDLDPSSTPVIRHVHSLLASGYERYVYGSRALEKGITVTAYPPVSAMTDGFHTLAFFADPLAVVPDTVDKLYELQMSSTTRRGVNVITDSIRKKIKMTLFQRDLHENGTTLWVARTGENRDKTFVSPGKLVYFVGGVRLAQDPSPTSLDVRLLSDYNVSFLEPAVAPADVEYTVGGGGEGDNGVTIGAKAQQVTYGVYRSILGPELADKLGYNHGFAKAVAELMKQNPHLARDALRLLAPSKAQYDKIWPGSGLDWGIAFTLAMLQHQNRNLRAALDTAFDAQFVIKLVLITDNGVGTTSGGAVVTPQLFIDCPVSGSNSAPCTVLNWVGDESGRQPEEYVPAGAGQGLNPVYFKQQPMQHLGAFAEMSEIYWQVGARSSKPTDPTQFLDQIAVRPYGAVDGYWMDSDTNFFATTSRSNVIGLRNGDHFRINMSIGNSVQFANVLVHHMRFEMWTRASDQGDKRFITDEIF